MIGCGLARLFVRNVQEVGVCRSVSLVQRCDKILCLTETCEASHSLLRALCDSSSRQRATRDFNMLYRVAYFRPVWEWARNSCSGDDKAMQLRSQVILQRAVCLFKRIISASEAAFVFRQHAHLSLRNSNIVRNSR
jgi:hypothetical protein